MKRWILTLIAAVVLTFTFTCAFAVHAVAAKAAQPAAVAAPAPAPAPEPHPEIREAIASLRRAREHMDHAAHDFGGHKVDAIRATDEAIRQLEICLKFDR